LNGLNNSPSFSRFFGIRISQITDIISVAVSWHILCRVWDGFLSFRGYIQKHKSKILVVEDEHLIGWSIVTVLRKAGFFAEHVFTGEEAIEKLHSATYDFVLTDIKLPQIDGFQVASEAKSTSPSVVVIVVSTIDEKIINAALEKRLVDFYIEKPFDVDEIRSVVLNFASDKQPY